MVLFTGVSPEERNADFFKGERLFENVVLQQGVVAQFRQTMRILKNIDYDRLIVGGWEGPIATIAPFMSPKSKNAVITESSYHESTTGGLKGLIKKLIVRRYSKSYVPGRANAELMSRLGFNGEMIETRGVGVFNYQPQAPFKPYSGENKLLYVGRLSPEKNLKRLIEVVNAHPDWRLTVVGFGPQEEELKSLAGSNIVFTGAIKNEELPAVYRSHDAFVLPSVSETWGLVVEEALNNGLPVAISERCGCAETWVSDGKYGLTFRPESIESVEAALKKVLTPEINNKMRKYISVLDFSVIESAQVACYL